MFILSDVHRELDRHINGLDIRGSLPRARPGDGQRPLKILILTTTFPRWKDDVVPSFVYHLSRQLYENGMEVFVLAPHHPGARTLEDMGGVKVRRFRYFLPARFERLAYGPGVLPNFKRSLLAKVQLPLLFISELLYAMFLIRKEKIDVINSHWLLPQGLVGVICRGLFRTPQVVVVHGSDVNSIKASAILRKACSCVLRHSDAVTVNSTYIRNAVVSIDRSVEGKVSYMPMGVDASVFAPMEAGSVKERYGAGRLIFSIGRLIDWKGMKYLVMAMKDVIKAVPDARLVIGGSGTEKANLERLSEELGLKGYVMFPGYIDVCDLPAYYSAADVFVLPSIDLNGQTEALGVVLLEAMASGTPVVGSAVGGIPDIIRDGYNGFLVPERSPPDLADRIVRLLKDGALADRFAANGLKTVNERFLWKDIAVKFSDVNKKVSVVCGAK
jgi:L-malate glycosyltransferase